MDLLDWFIGRGEKVRRIRWNYVLTSNFFFSMKYTLDFFGKKIELQRCVKKLVIKEEWRSLISNSG